MRVKHKNLHSTASQFVVTCVVWSLVAAVFLNMAAYRPQAGIAPVSEAAAAPAVAALQDTAGQPQQASTSSQASQQSPHSSSQAGLQPQDYKNTALVVVTTTSSPYLQFTRNWAAHLARIGANHAVIALDQQSFKVLTEQERLPAVLDASENAKQLGLNTDVSVRKEFAQLRHLGYLRIGLPLQLMQQYNWQAMILSDADVVWLRHPSELMQLYPHAELLVSTDCLSAKAVMQNQTDVYRCGMQPGGWNSAWNSGEWLFVFFNSSLSRLLGCWSGEVRQLNWRPGTFVAPECCPPAYMHSSLANSIACLCCVVHRRCWCAQHTQGSCSCDSMARFHGPRLG